MAKTKKTTQKKTGGFGGFFSKKKKRRTQKKRPSFIAGLKIALTVLFLTLLVGGGAIGLVYLEDFVKAAAKKEVPEGTVVFSKPTPIWLNQEWRNWIIEDVLGGTMFPLDADTAQDISNKLKSVAWFKDFTVQTSPACTNVQAEYRRPVGLISSAGKKLYVGDDMVIMNYIPMTAIPVIEIKGASSKPPEPGLTWLADDAKAAVELLDQLYEADLYFQHVNENRDTNATVLPQEKMPEKPLLNEIESIDVSNFAARKSRSGPNIVLNAKNGIKIYWGAAWGQATVYFEAEEKVKLTRLYQFFMEHNNTFQGTAKIIELRWLEDGIPRPR